MSTIPLWTIQPASVLEPLRESGVLRVDRMKLVGVPHAYRWLARQLRRRVPGYRGGLPWWFSTKRPDLRRHRFRWPRGEALVRLEVELDSARVASFPSWAWDLVYTGDFLARSLSEYRSWEAGLRRAGIDEDTGPLPLPWRSHLERSWERLFTALPDRPWRGYRRLRGWALLGTEAVAEEIRASDVRSATRLQGASQSDVVRRFYEAKRSALNT